MNASEIQESQTAQWQRQIEELQDQSRRAFLDRDIPRLRLLWSDGFVVNSPMGRVLERGQALDLLEKGVISHASYDEHVEVIKRHGDSVVVMGHDVITDSPGGPPIVRRFTNLWRAAGGSWQLVARHANPVAKP